MEMVEDESNKLTHDDHLEITKSTICTLLSCDSLLSDLPTDITLDEILAQIAVEHGKSITVFIAREDEPTLKVIVPQNSSVRELKKSIGRHFEMYQKRTGDNVIISWKYIWKTYDLSFDGIILDNDSSNIDDYGVGNKVTLTFKKRKTKR